MAEVRLDGLTKVYPNGFQAVTELRLELNDSEFLVPRRSVGMRQVHRAADDRRARGDHRRRPLRRRSPAQRRAAQRPRHRYGVPELRALPADDRRGEHRVPPAPAQDEAGRAEAGGGQGGRGCSSSPSSFTRSRPTCRAASASAWRWDGPSCASRRCSSWMSRCRTSTPSSACRCAPISQASNETSASPRSMSPTIRWRP